MAKAARRRAVVALVAVLAVAASVAVVVRVLAPAEVETVAREPYPTAPAPTAGVIGRLPVAPLVVDGRLRVYAGARQVYADQPATGRHRVTPFWSYRRWPATLTGVLAQDTTVVSRWSDGTLVALDARTGRVAWRADGPEPGPVPKPRRTYASRSGTRPGCTSRGPPTAGPCWSRPVPARSAGTTSPTAAGSGAPTWRGTAGPTWAPPPAASWSGWTAARGRPRSSCGTRRPVRCGPAGVPRTRRNSSWSRRSAARTGTPAVAGCVPPGRAVRAARAGW